MESAVRIAEVVERYECEVVPVHFLFEDIGGNDSDTEFIEEWVETHAVEGYPVLSNIDGEPMQQLLDAQFPELTAVPTWYVIDSEMKTRDFGVGVDFQQLFEVLDELAPQE